MTFKKIPTAVWLIAGLLTGAAAVAEEIGSVNTVFKLIGPDHKIAIEAFDDPDIPGVACYVSHAKKGGVSGALGLAEDTSDASIACRQVVPITLPDKVKSKKSDSKKSQDRVISGR